MQFEIGGRRYTTIPMTTWEKYDILRRLRKIADAVKTADTIPSMIGAYSGLSDEDVEYIFDKCLTHVEACSAIDQTNLALVMSIVARVLSSLKEPCDG